MKFFKNFYFCRLYRMDMDMTAIHKWIIALLLPLMAVSCSDDILGVGYRNPRNRYNSGTGIAGRNPTENMRRTLLLYSAGYNNLSSALREDIDDICNGYLPEGNYGYCDNMFIFAHHSVSDRDYNTPVRPCLIKVYRNRDMETVMDTVAFWSTETSAADAGTLREVLEYVRDNYPSKEYGMIFSSHATGWLPSGFPLEKSIGADYGNDMEMDIKDFAAAIPMKMEYIIFDACLVGGIELAYELKDVSSRLVFSSEEILADGMVYTDIVKRLLGNDPSDLEGVALDYFNHYNSLQGTYRSALVSVVDCSGLDGLADACKEIFSRHKGQIPGINPNEVQRLNFRTYKFYDLRDIVAHLADNEDELAPVDAALEKCIDFKAHTDYTLGSLKINTFSGLSMYLPGALSESTEEYLSGYYKDFLWNRATGYISDYL